MPKESIMIQVGQCGNQLGRPLWEQLLVEHSFFSKKQQWPLQSNHQSDSASRYSRYDDPMSTMFRNVDSHGRGLPVGVPLMHIRARGILIDTEGGVVSETLRSPIGGLFDPHENILTDNSGAGNNFAHGFFEYGQIHGEHFLELVRRQTEMCDSLQSFHLLHSVGGGTGSGLGTRTLELLADDFKGVGRIAVSLLPSSSNCKNVDDVVVSPYNAVMALRYLSEHADAVIPMDNAQLGYLSQQDPSTQKKTDRYNRRRHRKKISEKINGNDKRTITVSDSFYEMNAVATRALVDLTSITRFNSDATTWDTMSNIILPGKKFLSTSLSPKASCINSIQNNEKLRLSEGTSKKTVRTLTRSVFRPENGLLGCARHPIKYKTYSCGLFYRGSSISRSDAADEITKIRPLLNSTSQNDPIISNFCQMPPVGRDIDISLTCLRNSSSINDTLLSIRENFVKLYKRRAMVHHYTEFCEESMFSESIMELDSIIDNYKTL